MTSSSESEQAVCADASNDVDTCDVLVIGGGPAGSTVSSFLVEKGWTVVLLEKDHHPRFHIGESLLPMNLPILERLGVLEQVRKIGIVKPGIEMCSDRGPDRSYTYYFERSLNSDYSHSFEVQRSAFDYLLLRNCADQGVVVHEGVQVTDVAFHPDSTSLVLAKDERGEQRRWAARFVIDASGRNAFLSTRLGLKKRNERHNSAAIFGHFRNGVRRQGRDEGNIGLYWFEHGWIWMIPLPDGVMSVGAVCWPDYLRTRQKDLEAFLWDTIRLCPGVQERMRNAELIRPARATGNYSYRSRRMWGDGYLLIGDAYAFIDPVFSTGVYLAMNSATMAVDAVDASLRHGGPATDQLRRLDRRINRGLRTLSWFIYRFTTPAMHNLFMRPRNILRMEEAVLSVFAGDVFQARRIFMPITLFKVIYYLTSVANAATSRASYRRRKKNVGLQTNETAEVQTPLL